MQYLISDLKEHCTDILLKQMFNRDSDDAKQKLFLQSRNIHLNVIDFKDFKKKTLLLYL